MEKNTVFLLFLSDQKWGHDNRGDRRAHELDSRLAFFFIVGNKKKTVKITGGHRWGSADRGDGRAHELDSRLARCLQRRS